MKRLALALALISSALLSGCIIVPHRHGGYHHHHDGRYEGRYDGGGPVYVVPGPRR